jgi:hypothetical protein
MVLIYPIARPKNLTELIYLDAMHSALFYLHDNRYTEAHGRASFKGSPAVVSCQHQPLGTQHFLIIQVDGLDPRDFDPMRRLISESYGGSDSSPLSRSTLEAALLSTRHRYFDDEGSPVDHVFSQLAYNWNTSVGPSVLQQGTLARYLERRVDEAYPDFCSFVGRIFRQEPFVFTQTPSSKAPRRRRLLDLEADAASAVPAGLAAPLVVPSYNLTLHRVIKSSADAFTVRYPWKDEGCGAIVSTPVGDENRIHVNIGFDLTRLSSDLWLHALALLNTLEANSAHFAEEGKTAREIYSLSSSLTSRVVPISDDGCYFFVSTSVFPEDLAPFLDFLGTLFQNIHFQANSYLHGLDTQRNTLFSEIYNPAASPALDNAFLTRGLAGLNSGFLHREALVGLASLSRYNRILSAVSNNKFSESERRQHAAANWLFASSSLLLQYSAPRALEESAGRKLRSFYDAQRRWERSPARLCAPRMARNDLLIAPTVTSYAGRFVHLPEYKPEYAPVITYLRFLLSEELVSKRGFYRSDASLDLSTNVLQLRAWCGSSGVVPFKIYDRLPKELIAFRPTSRQLKGLQMGALRSHLGQLGGASPHETMLKRLRLHNAGQTAETFHELAEDILMNGRLSFETFAEILSAKRALSRNVVLTGREEAKKVPRSVAGIEFGRPIICTL